MYQIHTFINNLNGEEMTTSHLMCTFLCLRENKNSVIAKFRILEALKG